MATAGAHFEGNREKELEKILKKFGAVLVRKSLSTALRSGVAIITAEAKARAPVGDTGALKKAIKTRVLAGRGRVGRKNVALATSVSQKHMPKKYYASFVELGTKNRDGSEFFRAAFDAKEAEAEGKVTKTLDREIAYIWKSGGTLVGFKVNDGD